MELCYHHEQRICCPGTCLYENHQEYITLLYWYLVSQSVHL